MISYLMKNNMSFKIHKKETIIHLKMNFNNKLKAKKKYKLIQMVKNMINLLDNYQII
jgi:hypothetical protein